LVTMVMALDAGGVVCGRGLAETGNGTSYVGFGSMLSLMFKLLMLLMAGVS